MTELFVGRERELKVFDRLMGGEPRLRVLHIWGKGGIGKTKLLEAMWRRYCQITGRPDTPRRLIDLYEVAYHRITILEETVAEWYHGPAFADYDELVRQYASARQVDRSQEELAYYRSQLTRTFAEAMVRASQERSDPLLLLFDTFEHVRDRDVAHWLVVELLPSLTSGNLVVVIAGRPVNGEGEIDFGEVSERADVETLHLGPFSLVEVQQYFDLRKVVGLTDFEIQRFNELTEGRPVLVALASDWIREEAFDLTRLDPDHPEAWQQDDFENLLVRKILDLALPEEQIIPLMGHVHLRFDRDVLAFLQKDVSSASEAQDIIKNLARFSFVKYRPLSGSCQLHDEMQVLVQKHVWPAIDLSGQWRRELSWKIVVYYEQLLEATQDDRERQTFQTEQLYYAIRADIEKGFTRFIAKFDEALRGYELGFCELLIGVASRFLKQLSESQRLELEQRWARLLIRQERKVEAAEILLDLLGKDITLSKRAEVLGDLGANAYYQGDYIQAEKYYGQALRICEESDWKDKDARIGDIHNQLGLCYRSVGDLDKASEAFAQAFPLRKQHRGAAAVAATLTNWAFVFRHRENLELALGYGKLGLAIRQKLDRQMQATRGHRLRELGYSHEVLGIIYREAGYFKQAIHHFREALSVAEAVDHRYLVGLAQADLGYVHYLQDEFELAGQHLKEAERIFRSIDHQSGLANILSKLGRLYRKDKTTWDQAAAAFQEGLGLAENVGDTYYAMDNLINLAKLEQRRGQLDDTTVAYYQRKLKELHQNRYRFPLLLGIFENVLATYETERGNYEAAAWHYAQEQRHMAEFGELHKRIFDSVDRLTDQLFALPPGEMVSFSQQLVQGWEQQEMGPEAEATLRIFRTAQNVSEFLEG